MCPRRCAARPGPVPSHLDRLERPAQHPAHDQFAERRADQRDDDPPQGIGGGETLVRVAGRVAPARARKGGAWLSSATVAAAAPAMRPVQPVTWGTRWAPRLFGASVTAGAAGVAGLAAVAGAGAAFAMVCSVWISACSFCGFCSVSRVCCASAGVGDVGAVGVAAGAAGAGGVPTVGNWAPEPATGRRHRSRPGSAGKELTNHQPPPERATPIFSPGAIAAGRCRILDG